MMKIAKATDARELRMTMKQWHLLLTARTTLKIRGLFLAARMGPIEQGHVFVIPTGAPGGAKSDEAN